MICHSAQEAFRLQKENPDLEKRIYPAATAFDGRLRGLKIDKIHIDNLDLILPYVLGMRIGVVTATDE